MSKKSDRFRRFCDTASAVLAGVSIVATVVGVIGAGLALTWWFEVGAMMLLTSGAVIVLCFLIFTIILFVESVIH